MLGRVTVAVRRVLSWVLQPTLHGALAAVVAVVGAGAAASVLHRASIAAQALTAAAAAGAAVLCASLLARVTPRGRRLSLTSFAGATAAAFAVIGFGVYNPSVTAPGVQVGCFFGLPRCVSTQQPGLPMIVRSGGVQRHPTVHAIVWGAGPEATATVRYDVDHVNQLGQPLLRRAYGVDGAHGWWRLGQA